MRLSEKVQDNVHNYPDSYSDHEYTEVENLLLLGLWREGRKGNSLRHCKNIQEDGNRKEAMKSKTELPRHPGIECNG